MKVLSPPKVGSFLLVIFLCSYINWLIIQSRYHVDPQVNFFFFLSLPMTALTLLYSFIMKVQLIDVYFAPLIFFPLFSALIAYLIKKTKWHSISYIVCIYLSSLLLIHVIGILVMHYHFNGHIDYWGIWVNSYNNNILVVRHVGIIQNMPF